MNQNIILYKYYFALFLFYRSPRSQKPPLPSTCDLIILEHCRKWKAALTVQNQQNESQYTVYFGPLSREVAPTSLQTSYTAIPIGRTQRNSTLHDAVHGLSILLRWADPFRSLFPGENNVTHYKSRQHYCMLQPGIQT